MSARVLVTGGTGGIGLAAAEALARRGVEVLVTGRDAARGVAAEGRLRAAGTPGAFLRADHGSLADTRALVTGLHERLDGLDVLVANVGAMPSVRTTTPEGLDVELVTDVAGVVLLVDGLRPALAARGGRVVLVTSAAASRAPDPLGARPWDGARGAGMAAYARAKGWKLQLAAGLAAELSGDGVTVHAASPGPAWTAMTQANTREALGVPRPVWGIVRAVQRSGRPERAARCVVEAAAGPDGARSTGLLFPARGRPRPLGVPRDAGTAALAAARALATGTVPVVTSRGGHG